MDDGKDSLDLLDDLLDRYQDTVDYVVVKNKGWGDRFSIFEQSQAKQKALTMNARILELDGLYPSTMNRMDEINRSFCAAANSKDPQVGSFRRLLEGQRVTVWIESSYRKLEETGYFASHPAARQLAQVVEIKKSGYLAWPTARGQAWQLDGQAVARFSCLPRPGWL